VDPGRGRPLPGVLKQQYGSGKVLFFAFDLGMSSRNENPFDELLDRSAEFIHHPLDPTGFRSGELVPIELKFESLGNPYDIRATEHYPQEFKLYDPVAGQWITDNPWSFDIHLEALETKTRLFYALTPDKPGTYLFQTEVSTLENGTYYPVQSLEVSIPVLPTLELTMSGPPYGILDQNVAYRFTVTHNSETL